MNKAFNIYQHKDKTFELSFGHFYNFDDRVPIFVVTDLADMFKDLESWEVGQLMGGN